jgi:hypothetical protein
MRNQVERFVQIQQCYAAAVFSNVIAQQLIEDGRASIRFFNTYTASIESDVSWYICHTLNSQPRRKVVARNSIEGIFPILLHHYDCLMHHM